MRRPLIRAKDFKAFIGQGEQAQGRSWRLTKGEEYFVWEERGGGGVRKNFLVLMCGEMFMEKVCARIKHGRKLCVKNICSKAFGFLVQLVVSPKSTVEFVSK
jgi:hypothetical protein